MRSGGAGGLQLKNIRCESKKEREREAVQRCDRGEESVRPLSSGACRRRHTVLRRVSSPHLEAPWCLFFIGSSPMQSRCVSPFKLKNSTLGFEQNVIKMIYEF